MKYTLPIIAFTFLLAGAACTKTVTNTNTVANTNTAVPTYVERPDVVSSEVDIADWQTFENTELGYSYQYPKDWMLTTTPSASGYPIPKRFAATFEQNIKDLGKATPIPLMMSCSADSTTAAEYVQREKDSIVGESTLDGPPSRRNFQTYTLTSGVVTEYYVWHSLYYQIQEFVASRNGTFCILSMMRPSQSPLTKAEDGIAFQILNSFTFTK